MTRRRALLAIWGTAALLAAPWVIEAALIRARRTTWRPPAVPWFRITTGRLHP